MAQHFITALHVALAGLLVWAMVGDLKRREIPHWLVAAIALGAPAFWFAVGMEPWPGMAIQTGIAIATFALFALAFFMGQMGGGDVKLIGALALWLPLQHLIWFLIIMSLGGCVLSVAYWARQKWRKSLEKPEVPYGVAISLAGMWAVGQHYLNQFAG